jgi:hypothetical protein
MTPPTIRISLLRVLAAAKPYAVPQATLLLELNQLVRPSLTVGDLVKHLSWLKARDMIGFLPDAMDPENADLRKWLIREAGEAALNS